MTQSTINTPETEAAPSALDLTLFVVTLDWNVNNHEEGDYSDKVWARDEKEAVKFLAEEMAEHNDSGCETDAEREEFVKSTVASAHTHAAMRVTSTIITDCNELLAGPENKLSAEAAADLAALTAILKKYGAR